MNIKKTISLVFFVSFIATANFAYSQSNSSNIVEYDVSLGNFKTEELQSFQDLYMKQFMLGKREISAFKDPQKQITISEVEAICNSSDTIYVENPEPPYNLSMRIIKREFDPIKDMVGFRVKEEWSIDVNGDLVRKIIALAPIVGKAKGNTISDKVYVGWVNLK